MSISDKVKTIIAEQFGVDVTKITNETSFVNDLKADSLESIELIMDLEEKFGIEIPDEDVEKITTVSEVIRYIEEKKAKVMAER